MLLQKLIATLSIALLLASAAGAQVTHNRSISASDITFTKTAAGTTGMTIEVGYVNLQTMPIDLSMEIQVSLNGHPVQRLALGGGSGPNKICLCVNGDCDSILPSGTVCTYGRCWTNTFGGGAGCVCEYRNYQTYCDVGLADPGDIIEVELIAASGAAAEIYTDDDTTTFPFEGFVGESYCGPAVPNSTGATAVISATGSSVAANNDLTLTATSMPAGSFGYFITSPTQGLIAHPGGSQGNLCVTGSIGRLIQPGQIQAARDDGLFSVDVDLLQLPSPNGLRPVQAGETHNFQAWFRDSIGGMTTSNFTDAISVTFS